MASRLTQSPEFKRDSKEKTRGDSPARITAAAPLAGVTDKISIAMRPIAHPLRSLLFGALLLMSAQAESGPQPPTRLHVGAAECPPFVIREGESLTGLGIFLWDRVAAEMGVDYDITLYPLGAMLEDMGREKEPRLVNVGVSCLSITAEREKFIDFSHSFFETHIGIAVRQSGFLETFAAIMKNPVFLRGLGIFFGVAALVGALFFLLERGANSKLYTMETRRGKLLEAFLVGTVFITRGPINFWEFKSLTARVMATLLAISATFLIAGMTAILASAFTVQSLRSQVNGLQDLAKMRVGALASSTSSRFLHQNGIAHQTRDDLVPLIEELESGGLDAVVADAAVLKYTLKQGKDQGRYASLSVLPYEFDSQNYGFALEPQSPFVEDLNRALLTVRKTEAWRSKVLEYLGE
jgi:polar amino acid transport system substrate-binding protein